MNLPRVVGLAGPYCAGKNSVLPFFTKMGYEILDLDKIGHAALEWEKDRLVQAFGTGIVQEGRVDRRQLGKLVFRSRRLLKKLEILVHPRMRSEVIQKLSSHPTVKYVINAAILFRLGLDKLCDLVIWLDSPWWLRLIRGLKRDGLGLGQTLPRVFAQKQNLKALRVGTDIIDVKNRGDLEQTLQELREEWEKRYGAK